MLRSVIHAAAREARTSLATARISAACSERVFVTFVIVVAITREGSVPPACAMSGSRQPQQGCPDLTSPRRVAMHYVSQLSWQPLHVAKCHTCRSEGGADLVVHCWHLSSVFGASVSHVSHLSSHYT